MAIRVVSLDMACTLFWEPGCTHGSPRTTLDRSLGEVIRYLEGKGYRIKRGPRELAALYLDNACKLRGSGPERELWHKYILLRTLRLLGADIDHELLEEAYNVFIEKRASYFTLLPEARRLLEVLRSLGYTLVLTTATWAHDLVLSVLRKNDASRFFHLVYSTQLVGIPKNNPVFYRELATLLDARPADILHVGDLVEQDIRPARKAGLRTVYYGWRTQCRPTDPQPCIKTINELIYYI